MLNLNRAKKFLIMNPAIDVAGSFMLCVAAVTPFWVLGAKNPVTNSDVWVMEKSKLKKDGLDERSLLLKHLRDMRSELEEQMRSGFGEQKKTAAELDKKIEDLKKQGDEKKKKKEEKKKKKEE